jgi:ribonuclease HII
VLYYERKFTKEGYSLIAGVDEAGRGPLAGPVVSAAVILKSSRFENRINDSKVLTARQRENAYREITDKSFFAVGMVNHRIIDKINILQASLLSMYKAIERISPAPDLVLVDGNTPLSIGIPYKNIIGGDGKSLSIACASIVAKVTRDRIMAGFHKIWPEYNFLSHKGYGTKEHRDILKAIGPSPIQRLSFRL